MLDEVIGLMSETYAFVVRPFRRTDRETVRALCCETGFLGNPIDPVYEDRELLADFLTGYYTDREPESCLVLEMDGAIKGYLLGSLHPLRHQLYSLYQNASLCLHGLLRYRRYNPSSRRFIHWIVLHSWREVPATPRRAAHFHFNVLPEARQLSSTHALLNAYLAYLHRQGTKRVYGQIVVFESRRGARLFERYGFQVLNRSAISKFKRFTPESVFLCTVIKKLG